MNKKLNTKCKTTLRRVNNMNAVKRVVQVAWVSGLIVLGLGVWRQADAANPDTLTITVTPGNVNYAVAISSPFVQGYAFGTVNVGLTTVSTVAIGVQNAGTIMEYFSLGVVDDTPSTAWSNALAASNTTYAMYGLFQSGQPLETDFSNALNNIPVAPPGASATRHGQASTKTNPGSSQSLWLRLGMPTGTDDSNQHTLTLSINGQGS
ncbi:MAG: hypothetical protein A2992_07490 [Elusimicrobia bacterium RIFCSPLOWO2_01_FULL_59_12]|nr:MAG: hypothetical protein A2992_07490 [Elusimicrobia bacterium RIFCSPLOWO2_01_FULL_59_12]